MIRFTGFDCFLLALEKHDTFHGTSGNTCRYVLELDGVIDKNKLEQIIQNDSITQELVTLRHNKHFLQTPFWEPTLQLKFSINTYTSDDLIPETVLNRKQNLNDCLIAFDLVIRSNSSSCLIFSWHHLLMDGFGAAMYIENLFNTSTTLELSRSENHDLSMSGFIKAAKAKFFIDQTSRGPLMGMSPKKKYEDVNQVIKMTSFSEEEVQQLDKMGMKYGARFGRKAYLLACAARSVHALISERGEKSSTFWIPVPNDDRKKGAKGPIVGNRLSFLFYRLTSHHLNSITDTVKAINEQMVDQIKSKMPIKYGRLMSFMKWLPSWLYYFLVKRKGSNSLAGFLFTMAPEHPTQFQELMGKKITNASSWPSNTYPPGLTFAFMPFAGKINLLILYYRQVITEQEYAFLEKHIREELLTSETKF